MTSSPSKPGRSSAIVGLLTLIALAANGGMAYLVHRDVSRLAAYLRSTPDEELPKPLLAGRAADLAESARAKGDPELARFYLMNAVARAPGDVNLLAKLADWTTERGNTDLEGLDRAQSVLQLAAYQVDPGEVPRVLELVGKVDAARQEAIEGSGEAEGEGDGEAEGRDPGREWEDLRKQAPQSAADPDAVAGYIERLRGFAEGLAGSVADADRSREEEVVREIGRWGRISRIATQCRFVDNCLAKLGKDADLASQKSVSIVQAAEAALPNFWGEDLGGLPEELTARIDAYPEAIRAKVAEIGTARSRPILDRIEAIIARKPQEDAPWEQWCKFKEQQMKEVQGLMIQISAEEGLRKAQARLEEMGGVLRRWRQGQYDGYQRWALKTIKEAFDQYQGFSSKVSLNISEINVKFSSEDADKILESSGLLQIDQTLLSPEVSRMYGDVIQKLFDTYSPDQLVAWEKAIGESAKKKLEDF